MCVCRHREERLNGRGEIVSIFKIFKSFLSFAFRSRTHVEFIFVCGARYDQLLLLIFSPRGIQVFSQPVVIPHHEACGILVS